MKYIFIHILAVPLSLSLSLSYAHSYVLLLDPNFDDEDLVRIEDLRQIIY